MYEVGGALVKRVLLYIRKGEINYLLLSFAELLEQMTKATIL